MQPCGVIGEKLFFRGHVISARQIGARTLIARQGIGFGDGLGLWLPCNILSCHVIGNNTNPLPDVAWPAARSAALLPLCSGRFGRNVRQQILAVKI